MYLKDQYTLTQYLKTVDCEEYLQLFNENGITTDLLHQLDRPALKELGVRKVGDRLRLQILIQQLNTERLKSLIPVNDLIETINNSTATLNGVDENITQSPYYPMANSTGTTPTSRAFRDIATIIAPDGSTISLNINGLFNSSSIKRKALKKMGYANEAVEEWRSYYLERDTLNLHSLLDVELTTICHSEREEKNRLILCRRTEQPSNAAIQTSKLIIDPELKTDERSMMKNFMGQRPPSQLISTNLGEYFPDTGASQLKEVMRNSVRLSIYSNRMLQPQNRSGDSARDSIYSQLTNTTRPLSIASSAFSFGVGIVANAKPTIGDVMLNNSTSTILAVKEEDEEGAEESFPGSEYKTALGATLRDLTSNTLSNNSIGSRMSVSYTKKTTNESDKRVSSIIELFDDEEDEEFFDSSDDVSNKMGIYGTEANEGGPSVWHKGTKIGQGSFGTVYLGLNGLSGELMAIKQVELPNSSTESSKVTMIDALKQEMSLLKVLNHNNIVRYLGSSSDSQNLYIFLEYVPGGSVSSMLNTYGPFEEPLVRNFIAQVLVGLNYLHNEGIIHRDIKGANILIDINGTVKISDFGISKKIDLDEDVKVKKEREKASKKDKRASLQGSVYWMAPEVVKQIAYTDKADIWSLGCLIVEMFTGKHPYPGFSQMQAIFRIGMLTLPEVPKTTTDTAREFIMMTFETDYTKRVGASELLKHPFITPLITTDR